MELYRIKNFVLTLIAFLFIACDNHEFKSINPDLSYEFKFDGFSKELSFGQQKPFVLAFFTKDCGVCKEQIAILKDFSRENEIKIFTILGDARDKQDAILWAEQKGLDLTLFYESKAADFLSRVVGGIYGVPVIVFYDENSRLRQKFIGLTPKGVLEKELKNIQI
ncbi:thioredoxin [Campylobacter sp. MIT 99-7217]|uniref:TlpA disulfide reductase family protein n=1 Tax=Campylobacter sp. MIT 99-7217 TaxID=535091 RepID=UPI00115B20C1|nr:TlpA disulfide reductase family protein [Campylobacter sp. MIT 99-7217]TQR29526.1 thioredoxin [Campylobacter sp. MIT 99-7217]